ncbi:MAG: histone deacetylase family protein [Gemmatimonadales bacterium]
MTAVFSHPACLDHPAPAGFPEQPDRLGVLLQRLKERGPDYIRTAEPAEPDLLLTVHAANYLSNLKRICESGGGMAGPEAELGPESWNAILSAAGAVRDAVDYAHAGHGHSFAAIRPPGHHALGDGAMGFCFVNHAAVAAHHARSLGRERCLIIDWDVHHGNGTQSIVESDPAIRFVSLHQSPWYPGTGAADERGVGNIFNCPNPPGLPPAHYIGELWRGITAALDSWAPGMVILSAGYDCLLGDPLGGFTLEPEHVAEWVRRLRDRLPGTPVVGVMEGGYAPSGLAEGVIATLGALD